MHCALTSTRQTWSPVRWHASSGVEQTAALKAWDLITPNRASSNIGEFAILLPGEEQVVLTKEVFVFRVANSKAMDPFYLLWAFSLKPVRDQWRRIVLMQTNREDCGTRYREILLPKPPDRVWAKRASAPFRSYFTALANARTDLVRELRVSKFEYTANVIATAGPEE